MPHSFTQGPWSFMQSSVAGRYIVSAENTPLDICVLSNRNKSHDEIQENARLIASAPDLLKQRDELLAELRATESRLHEVSVFCATIEQQRDELLAALKQMVSIVAIHSRATKNNFAWAEMDEANAAIAKAGGES